MHSPNVIVSLTSYPARINTVCAVIKSLLAQSVIPNKIILYLAMEEFPSRSLPDSLLQLQKDTVFEIRWAPENFKSYNKLIWALKDFPNSLIITVDDDILYPKSLVKTLLKTHTKYPKYICAHRIRQIATQNNKVQPYNQWGLSEKRGIFEWHQKPSFKNFLCGVGGVLYPPHSLHSDVMNANLFIKFCKHQDDVWFWAMAVLNNTKIIATPHGYNLRKRTISEVQSVGLWNSINNQEISPNNIALNNIMQHYPELKAKLGIV